MERDQLIHAMMSAAYGVIGSPAEQREDFKGMASALDVVLAEVMGEPSIDERHVCRAEYGSGLEVAFARWLASRRALYSKVKTAEEQITISGTTDCWRVMDNGAIVISLVSKKHAEIYRLGLIAQLKEQANANSK